MFYFEGNGSKRKWVFFMRTSELRRMCVAGVAESRREKSLGKVCKTKYVVGVLDCLPDRLCLEIICISSVRG